MSDRNRSKKQAGFTLLEVLVTMAVIGIAAAIGIPAMQQVLLNSKVQGVVNTLKIDLTIAKQEAIRRGVPVVVDFDTALNRVLAYADVPDLAGTNDYVYTPDTSKPHRTVDYLVFDRPLPVSQREETSIRFGHPIDGTAGAVNGFVVNAGTHLVFQPNGSVIATGSVVLGDFRGAFADLASGKCGNCFRLNVAPQATGRIDVEKYHHEDAAWYRNSRRYADSNRTEATGNLWKWY